MSVARSVIGPEGRVNRGKAGIIVEKWGFPGIFLPPCPGLRSRCPSDNVFCRWGGDFATHQPV